MKVVEFSETNLIISSYVIAQIISYREENGCFEYQLKFHKNYKLKNGILSNKYGKGKRNNILIQSNPFLHVGDVIEITKQREIAIHLSYKSNDNSIIVNNHCNLVCINCPQKSNNKIDGLEEKNFMIIDFIDEKYKRIGLTGGEPTLDIQYLINLITRIYERNNNIEIDILTNAINLSDYQDFKKLHAILKKKVTFCIALYSDTPETHDNFTGVKGSFWKTVKALHIIASFYRAIELRFVINKLNFERLPYFIEYIYNHFPYVKHVSLMGMEYSGEAYLNADKLFVKQAVYSPVLESAMLKAKQRNITVYLYNLQLCKISPKLWNFCVPSISYWKAIYLGACNGCDLKGYCGGVFKTSNKEYLETDVNPIDLSVERRNV